MYAVSDKVAFKNMSTSNGVKRYEGWIRLILIILPMVAGYYDLKYSALDSLRQTEILGRKIDKIEDDSKDRSRIIEKLSIDVAVLKDRINTKP